MTPTTTLTTNETVAAGAVLGGMLGVFGALTIAFYILMIVAMWKIFTKAGEKGWKSLIPIYNIYIYYKIAGMKTWFWITFAVNLVISIIATVTNTVVVNKAGQVTAVSTTASPVVSFLLIAALIFSFIVGIVQCANLSKAFKRGVGTTLGLIFLPCIFQLILAFGSAKYDKKAFADKK